MFCSTILFQISVYVLMLGIHASSAAGTVGFTPVFEQSAGNGIGGYDLKSTADLVYAFDYNHTGKLDHLALYRPGAGTFWILQNNNATFVPMYTPGNPPQGIGGYDVSSSADRSFAFDYDHSGKQDYIALYRPGTGTMWILLNNGGVFSPVYHQGDPGIGIGGYNLLSLSDNAFAFDYDHSGKLDYLTLYRPGTGTIWILQNTNGSFSPVYQQGDPGIGIGGYNLLDAFDQVFAFDYDQSGKLDHLVLYRPGSGLISILRNTAGAFSPVYNSSTGIGGYDLQSVADRIIAYDHDGSGKLDHLALYRPGAGTIWILRNNNGTFSSVYRQGDPSVGLGIGGYDLKSSADRAFAYDYASNGTQNYLALYRPGAGTMWILQDALGVGAGPSEDSQSDGASSVKRLGAPIGGAIGGVVAICLIILAVFYIHRRRRHRILGSPIDHDPIDYMQNADPTANTILPYHVPYLASHTTTTSLIPGSHASVAVQPKMNYLASQAMTIVPPLASPGYNSSSGETVDLSQVQGGYPQTPSGQSIPLLSTSNRTEENLVTNAQPPSSIHSPKRAKRRDPNLVVHGTTTSIDAGEHGPVLDDAPPQYELHRS